MITGTLLVVLLLRHALAQEEGMRMGMNTQCPDTGECTFRQRLHLLEEFFNISPPKETQQTRNSKQYYTTEYDTGYGTAYPGYTYVTGAESSPTFNGLDAALSALAFLAFGVWLFNLILPQLQGAGLGVPGLGRGIGQTDSFVGEGEEPSDRSVISKIFSKEKDLIDSIFTYVESNDEHIKESILKILETLFSKYGKAAWIAFQDVIWKPGERDFKQTESKTTWKPGQQIHKERYKTKTVVKRSLISKSKNQWTIQPSKPGTHVNGRGLLEDLLRQVWKPFYFIKELISQQNTDHEFPNSRTETVIGNLDSLGEDLQNPPDNSINDFWNGKMNSLDTDIGSFRNSFKLKGRHRHKINLV